MRRAKREVEGPKKKNVDGFKIFQVKKMDSESTVGESTIGDGTNVGGVENGVVEVEAERVAGWGREAGRQKHGKKELGLGGRSGSGTSLGLGTEGGLRPV
jgi:hypothetical protein